MIVIVIMIPFGITLKFFILFGNDTLRGKGERERDPVVSAKIRGIKEMMMLMELIHTLDSKRERSQQVVVGLKKKKKSRRRCT